MPTTPIYGWPFQQLGDPPDGAKLGEDLALAIEATVFALAGSLSDATTDITDLTMRVSDLETDVAAIQAELALPQPGQLVGSTSDTTDSGTFTTVETQTGSITFTEEIGVIYIIECEAKLVSSGTDINQARFRIDNTSGAEMDAVRHASQTSDQARPNSLSLRIKYTGTANGSRTIVVTCVRISGAGTLKREADTTYPQLITAIVVDRP